MAVSTATLATLRDRVELMLQDTGNATWATGDIDEGLTQALDRYSEAVPARTIFSLTLTAAGREVDISSLSAVDVERVWWTYTSSDPAYPPNWRDFEVWPGDILFIKDGSEPAVGDKVRVFYTVRQTLNGLRSAAASTFQVTAESVLVLGGAGYAAAQRAVETSETLTVDGGVGRRLREWAEARLAEFEAGLARAVRREAARYSGIAPSGKLDRWDEEGSGWW